MVGVFKGYRKKRHKRKNSRFTPKHPPRKGFFSRGGVSGKIRISSSADKWTSKSTLAQKSKKSSNFDKKFPTVGLHVTDTHLKSSRAIKTRDLIASLKMKERVKMETKKAYFKKLQDKKDFLLASQDLSKIVYVACFAKTKNNLFLSISETYSQQIRFVRSSGYVTQFQGLPHSSKRGPEAQRALSTFGRAKLLKIQATKLVIIFKGKVGQREQLVEFLTRRSKMKVLFLGAVTATPHNGCRGWKRKRTKRKRRRGRDRKSVV